MDLQHWGCAQELCMHMIWAQSSCGTCETMITSLDSVGDKIFDFYTFIPFLQYFHLVYQDGLCTGNKRFGSEALNQIKMASAQETEGLILTDEGSAKSNCLIFYIIL